MSQEAIEAVFNHSQSKGSVRLVLLTLAYDAHSDGSGASAPLPILEAKTNLDRREIQRHIKRLCELGELEKVIGGGRTVNTYNLLLPIAKQGKPRNRASAQERARKSTLYREWRIAVLKRDGCACKMCDALEDLHVHHIKPFAKFPELRFEVSNGITLCELCHYEVAGAEMENATKFSELIGCEACQRATKPLMRS
jgi:hypothetical protein